MIPEKTKRSLRRMRRRIASYRRQRVATLRNHTSRAGTVSATRAWDGSLRYQDEAARSDGSRRLTRQELRVEAELHFATHELGLS